MTVFRSYLDTVEQSAARHRISHHVSEEPHRQVALLRVTAVIGAVLAVLVIVPWTNLLA